MNDSSSAMSRRPGQAIGRALAAILLLAASLRVAQIRAAENSDWEAAAGRFDITPEFPVQLYGVDPVFGPSEGVEDPLHGRVLVLRDADRVLSVLVVLDAFAVTAALRERICGAIRPELGIYRVRVAVVATGTERTPVLAGSGAAARLALAGEVGAAASKYTDTIVERAVSTIRETTKRVQPARVVHGSEGLERLVIRDLSGTPRAVLFPVAETATTPEASVDLVNRVSSGAPGRVARALETALPGLVALPVRGARVGAVAASGRPGEALERDPVAALAGPERSLGGRIDARFDYVSVAARSSVGLERATVKFPLQVWSLGGELSLLFYPGSSLAAPDSAVWPVTHANADPAVLGGWTGKDEIASLLSDFLRASPGDLLARVKPPPALSPGEALQSFRLLPGLRIELVAAEPLVTDPVAIAFDHRGALYVAEMVDYPLGPGSGKPPESRVRRLADRDGDGFFETSTVFAGGLPYVSGIVCWRNGVLVPAERDIIFLEDTTGDSRADVRRVILTGFLPGNSQHLVNSPGWGHDNWIYFNGGDGADIEIPSKPGREALSLRYTSFRFRPDDLAIEPTTGYRGGFGIGFDVRGHRFVCDNQNHACRVVFERADLEGPNGAVAGETMAVISAHGADIHPSTAPLERFNDPFDVGRFSAACGVHVYGGDRLPPEFDGNLFSCEPVSNLVHRDALVGSGAITAARRVDVDREFLASTDYWFRPVNCSTGPDGGLYIVDMYREVIEHPEWIPLHIQKLFDLRSGRDRGRIYRVVGDEESPYSAPDFERLTGYRGAATLLASPISWWRSTSQRLLVERRDPASVVAVEEVLETSELPAGRSCALWTLEGLGALRPRHVLRAMGDPDPAVRIHGARLAGRLLAAPGSPAPAELAAALGALGADPDARVRLRTALSVGALGERERMAPLLEILRRDVGDRWARTAVLLSAPESPIDLLARCAPLADAKPSPGWSDFMVRLTRLVGAGGGPEERYRALDALTRPVGGERGAWRIPAVAAVLTGMGSSGLEAVLASAPSGLLATGVVLEPERVRENLGQLLARIEETAADPAADLGRRVHAVQLLVHDEPERAFSNLRALMSSREPDDLQRAAIRGLDRLPGEAMREAVSELLVEKLRRMSPAVRAEALDVLVHSRGRAMDLLEAIADGRARPDELSPSHRRDLEEHPDPGVREEARRLLSELSVDPDRDAVVTRYREAIAALDTPPDASRGRELFVEHCSSCHLLRGVGHTVGPDLSALVDRERDAFIADVLDPNRAVDPRYFNYLVTLRDGRFLNGVLVAETPGGVVLRRAEGATDQVPRREMLALEVTGKSLMPEGLEQEIGPALLRDIVAYLKTP